jgi:hypothetical protein
VVRIPGGIYAVALPSGEWACPILGQHILTHRGQIPFPGFGILECRIWQGHEFRIVGKAQGQDGEPHLGTWLRTDAGWSHISPSAHGTYPAIFLPSGEVVTANASHGVNGFRYVREDGRLITGDEVYNPQRWRDAGHTPPVEHLSEFTYLGGVFFGQADDPTGCHVLIDGERRLLLEGDTRFINVEYDPARDIWGVGITRLREADAHVFWLSRADLSTLPRITSIDVTPTPPPVTPPPPEPTMPDSLLPTVEAVRAKYPSPSPDDLGVMLNEIAWTHRADGWGLNSKPSGNSTAQPGTGIRIAVDILHHKPTDTLWDCFADAGGETRPVWGEAHPHGDPVRVWVAPVAPDGVPAPPEPPPLPVPIPGPILPNPGTDTLALILAELQKLNAHLGVR